MVLAMCTCPDISKALANPSICSNTTKHIPLDLWVSLSLNNLTASTEAPASSNQFPMSFSSAS